MRSFLQNALVPSTPILLANMTSASWSSSIISLTAFANAVSPN